MNGQTNIFEMLYENYKIKTPIKMIELFAGYGATAFAWKYMNVPFEHHKICEWAVNSIQAYKDAHIPNDNNDYSKEKTKEELIEILYKYGISSNYNEPMKYEQISRMSESKIRTIYNNIIATHNLVNIQNVKADDLEIKDTKLFTYLLTYSFPCQDLSLAGKGKGMSDTTTRSGMLWEVERILNECKELPQILLMENVPQVHSQDNMQDFCKWQESLEKMGYKNYWQDLIATDYGIPQTRNRCFMISILGDYNYTFPTKVPLKLRLKDMLEENVDEKYYLTEKMLDYIVSKDDKYKVNENKLVINREIACSKTTREGNTRADTTDYICNDLPENTNILKIKNNKKEIGEKVKIIGNYSPSNHNASRVVDRDGLAPTVMENHGTITAANVYSDIERQLFTKDGNIKRYINSDIVDEFKDGQMATTSFPNGYGHDPRTHDESISLNTIDKPSVKHNLRIRKLTPKECFRLMGVKDEDFERIARHQSNASLYHLAGDSIVVDVIKAIYGQLI